MATLWSVRGNSQKLDGGAMFGNAPRTLWQAWLPADEQHRVTLACRALLAEGINGRRVLFEAGIGAFFEPRLKERYGVLEPEHVLLASLAAREVAGNGADVLVQCLLMVVVNVRLVVANWDADHVADRAIQFAAIR